VTELAHALGLSVTVEGVETREQHDAIADLGCELAQGYLYGRPGTAADVGTLVRRQR
jgi:diguanylate cyclase